jgi:hypothetical protein
MNRTMQVLALKNTLKTRAKFDSIIAVASQATE